MTHIPPTSHVTLLATLRRDRLLPVAGEVLVSANQKTEAGDLVARALVADSHHILNLTRDLGVPAARTAAFMVKKDGDLVKKGEAVAVRKTLLGLLSRESRSAVEGMLIASGEGKALLAAFSKPFELRAGLPGVAIRVIENLGVTIETTGALLEGVWGNGRDVFAVLRVLDSGPREALQAGQVDAGMRGQVVVAGALMDAAPLKPLADAGVKGLVVGSARAELLPALQKLDFPTLVVEGFGAQGLSAPAYNLLSGNTGRELWLNACAWQRYAARRPEVIIPLPLPGQAPPIPADGQSLEPGKRVRVLRGPYIQQTGVVRALHDRQVTLPSGVRARVAAVELDEGARGQMMPIPFANLEILE